MVSDIYRSSHRRCTAGKGVLRNFPKFTGKHLCQSLIFNKVAGQENNFTRVCVKKETLAQVFSYEFWKISKHAFCTEHLWATASVFSRYIVSGMTFLKKSAFDLKKFLYSWYLWKISVST